MGHDTITQTLYKQQNKKSEKNKQVTFSFVFHLFVFVFHKTLVFTVELHEREPMISEAHYLARARNRILIEPETTRLPFVTLTVL